MRRELELVAVAAHRAEQAAHLRQRCASGPLDVLERVAVVRELVGQPVPHGADLEHHHADRVRDDVVQLAGDPRALLGDGEARRRLALALRLRRARLGRLGLLLRARAGRSRRASRSPNRSGMKTSSPAVCVGSL